MKDMLGTNDINPCEGWTCGDFTFTATKADGGTAPAYYANGYDMRVYANGTFTIEAKDNMTKIVFTISKKGLARLAPITATVGEIAAQAAGDETVTWTGDAKAVTFTVGNDAEYGTDGPAKRGQLCFTQLDITGGGEGGPAVIDPTPGPTPGEAVADIAAWIAKADTQNAVSISGNLTAVYQNGNALYVKDNSGWLLVYGAVNQTYNNGDIIAGGVAGTFKDYNGLPEMENPTGFTAGVPGTAVEAEEIMASDMNAQPLSSYVKLTDVTISDPTDEQGRTFPANDGSEDFTIYNSYPKTVNIPTGTGFTVYGFVSVYKGSYQLTAVEVVTETGEQTVATPRFSPAAGAVTAGTEVAITCATADAAIHYTIDGTEPTAASTLYTAPIVVNEAMTIKAIAVKEGMTDSAVATAEYTIAEVIEPGDEVTFKAPEFADVEGTVLVNNDGSNTATSNDTPDSCLDGESFTAGNVTINFVHGTDADENPNKYYTGAYGKQVRWMQGNIIEVVPATDYKIVKIFVQTDSYSKGNFSAYDAEGNTVGSVEGEGTGVETPITWTGDVAGTITLVSNKQVRFRYMTVGTAENGSVDGIASDDVNAPVEYYNLQGVRVAEPANGLYIRRQGNTVTKVLVK